MAQLIINIGVYANDGAGDTFRAAFDKANENFTELYSNVSTLQSDVSARVLQVDFDSHTGDTNNPHSVDLTQLSGLDLTEYADDAAAGVGGLVAGDLYSTNGTVKIKL